jgi:hypothetical protein
MKLGLQVMNCVHIVNASAHDAAYKLSSNVDYD